MNKREEENERKLRVLIAETEHIQVRCRIIPARAQSGSCKEALTELGAYLCRLMQPKVSVLWGCSALRTALSDKISSCFLLFNERSYESL